MMLVCPACSAQYEVAETKIPAGGRSVKCASCHHVWTAIAPIPASNGGRGAFPQRRPSAPRREAGLSAGAISGSTYFSRPVTSVRGNAALAALFDERHIEEEPEIVEGRWKALAEETTPLPVDFSIEGELEKALSANPVARRQLEQQKRLEAPHSTFKAKPSPFHNKIAEAEKTGSAAPAESTALTVAPVPHDLPRDEEDHSGEAAANAESLSREAGTALRTLARISVKAFGQAGDWLEGLIPRNLFVRTVPEEAPVTPGDRQVSAWRERQRRKERNRMTPLRFIGWAAWATSIGGIVAVAVFFRTDIMDTWPRSKSAYAAVGLPQADHPVSLQNISHRFAVSNKGPVIELRGALRHDGAVPVATPLIQADAYDAEARLLASWIFRTSAPAQMLPQMETPFLTRSLAPAGITRIEMRLVAPETVLAGRVKPADQDETGQPAFFMQKTVGGWGADQEVVPPAGQ